MSSPDKQTRRILFTGHVQGVGFRWTTNRLAKNYPVTGFVRNLADGRVELVAEGRIEHIEALLDDIRNHFQAKIESVEDEVLSETEEFFMFNIG